MHLSMLVRFCVSMEDERRERCTVEESSWISRAYNERKDCKHGSEEALHDGIIVLSITCASET